MVEILANSLIPVFAGLLVGYIAGIRKIVDNKDLRTLITFVMSFAVPSSMFLAIASTPRGALRQQAAAALVLTIVYVVLYAMSFLWVHSRHNLPPSDSSVVALTLGFPNSAAVGLPLLALFSVHRRPSRWRHPWQSGPSRFLRLRWHFWRRAAVVPAVALR